MSIGFVAGAWKDYRKEFRSARFIFFVCAWLVINMVTFAMVLASFGWLYLLPILFLEQILFYASVLAVRCAALAASWTAVGALPQMACGYRSPASNYWLPQLP
jgi:hypothetical protein